ncbi:MAG: class I SAM-dependent methyltransferase [Paracoccaceae bacterium]
MPDNKWNERYSGPEYRFGTEPADFLRRAAEHLEPGQTALCIADGEGRNSVWLAERGLSVTAMDASPVGVEKARKLAAQRGVEVDFHVADIAGWDWDAAHYDVVVGVFFQFAEPDLRARIFDGMKRALRPGGLLLLHGYAPRQVAYGTGGPPQRENMYTTELLADAFAGFDVLRLEDYDAEISEGTGHSGRSALVDLIARKPL